MRTLPVLLAACALALAGCGGGRRHPDGLGRGVAEEGADRSTAASSRTRRRASRSPARTSWRRRSARARSRTCSPPPTPSCPTSSTTRAWSRSRSRSRATGSCSPCPPPRTPAIASLQDIEKAGRHAGDRLRERAGRLLHAHRAVEAAGVRELGDPEERALGGARRGRDRRQAHAGRGRRRLRLHLRRARDGRSAEGDRAAGVAAADGGLRRRGREGRQATRTPRRRSSTGCSTATASRRSTTRASSRRRRSEAVPARPRRLARRLAAVPHAAGRGDLPRHLARRARAQPGGGGGARRAAAEPDLLDRRAGAHRARSAPRPPGCWPRAASAGARW